jgi:hypothetical protein
VISLDSLYFEWLLTRIDANGVREGVAYVCDLLHDFVFERRVGNDINRAAAGADLRKDFMQQFDDANFDPHVTNSLMMQECSWFEMMVALAINLDYIYDGGVEERFLEMVENMQLGPLLEVDPSGSERDLERDKHLVGAVVDDIDNNQFDRDGHGGLFPLSKPGHPDQRRVEIWDQHAAYFRERLEVLWTSTS